MSTEKDVLEKIHKHLEKIGKRQDEICERLGQLERSGTLAAGDELSHDDLVTFLDQFRAGEALGEASLGAWIEVADLPCVKGGLRTVQQREGMHARLLEARLKELGATPCFEIPEVIYQRTMRDAGNPDKPDAEKVADFVKQFPDIDAALKPIYDIIAKLDHDQETQFMLRTIAQDERSTLEFLQEACQLLNG
jgi:DNA-binding ferritin-like protein